MPNKKLSHEFLMQCFAKAQKIQARTGGLGIRDCGIAWGYPTSTSSVAYVMARMEEAGMLLRYKRGKKKTACRVNPDYKEPAK